MEEEIWKTIPISIKYEASTRGRIRRIKTGHILKYDKDARGYLKVDIKGTFYENITRCVHQLVAITFIPNPDNEPTVNHINHKRSDNNINNLEWASQKKQKKHSRKRKLTPEEDPSSSKWGKRDIWKCNKLTGERIKMFKSIREAACAIDSSFQGMSQIFNVAENHEISNSLSDSREGRLVAAGFKWEYDELRTFKTEEWCSIDPLHTNGVEGYEISTLGRLFDPKGIVRSPINGGDYPVFNIKGIHLAHRLVALTFLPIVDGKDFDNLEFCSRSENMQHAYENDLFKKNKKIWQYDLNGNFIKEFNCMNEVKDELGIVSASKINTAIVKESVSCGFLWRRKSDDKSKVIVKRIRKTKKAWQYDLDGNFIKEFNSAKEVKDKLGIDIKLSISKGGSAGGFIWKRPSDDKRKVVK